MSLFGKIAKGISKAATSVSKAVASVPVVGTGLRATYSLTVGAPIAIAGDVVRGKRLDRVAFEAVKRQAADIKDIAPYAQMVLSTVPGVGTGIAGAIGASIALAEGQPITAALASGVRGALPGGPIARAAFDLGAAAAQGKPLDKSLVMALPIPDAQKRLVVQGLEATKAIAAGKRVDTAIIDQAIKHLPPEARKALTIGVSLAHGANMQKTFRANLGPNVAAAAGKVTGGITLQSSIPLLPKTSPLVAMASQKGGRAVFNAALKSKGSLAAQSLSIPKGAPVAQAQEVAMRLLGALKSPNKQLAAGAAVQLAATARAAKTSQNARNAMKVVSTVAVARKQLQAAANATGARKNALENIAAKNPAAQLLFLRQLDQSCKSSNPALRKAALAARARFLQTPEGRRALAGIQAAGAIPSVLQARNFTVDRSARVCLNGKRLRG